MTESVAAKVMPFRLDASKSRAARWSTGVAVVVAIHIEGGLDTSCLQCIQHFVGVPILIWGVVKRKSDCLHNTERASAIARESLHTSCMLWVHYTGKFKAVACFKQDKQGTDIP